MGDRRFVVELIKPSHYDDDGYVIQWWKSWIPSNSLACLYGIAQDLAERRALGTEVAIEIHAYDECHTVIPVSRIIRHIKSADAGLVCLVGVQSNQFPRAMDLAARFRAAGIQVIDGPYLLIRDVDGFREAASRAAALGYDGKWVLHPGQIEPANEVFTPSQADFDKAARILEAYRHATEVERKGAVMMGDEMIDEASRKMAQQFFARGVAAGLAPSAVAAAESAAAS